MNIREKFGRAAAVDGLPIALALVVVIAYFSIASPFFMTGENIRNLLMQSIFTILLAAGMTFVLISGGIDLSVGSATGLSAAVTLLVLMNGGPLAAGIAAGVATGAVIGAINGFFIAVLGINAFIVTLASLSIGAGALQVLTSEVQLTGVDSPGFAALTKASILGIPAGLWATLAIVAILEWILLATPLGRGFFAMGTNRQAAFLAGTNVRRLELGVYLISGTVAGTAGVLLASHLNSVQPGLGQGYEFTAIAAAVLGGIALFGGRGSVWRSVVGALFLATLSQGLQLTGVDPLWFNIVTGTSIVAAVALDRGVQHFVRGRLTSPPKQGTRSGPPPEGPTAASGSDEDASVPVSTLSAARNV